MAKTEAELARRVMLKMGKIDAETSPTAADQDFVISEYRSKYEEWKAEDLVYWSLSTTDDVIPEAVFPVVVRLVLNEVQGAFGLPSTLEETEARNITLMRQLRRHMARQKTGMPTRAVYY